MRTTESDVLNTAPDFQLSLDTTLVFAQAFAMGKAESVSTLAHLRGVHASVEGGTRSRPPALSDL
jgi:hypothetical protein